MKNADIKPLSSGHLTYIHLNNGCIFVPSSTTILIQQHFWSNRFYMKGSLCVMRMVDAEFDYTYEYQGNAPKLVHTPLTDKCYLTLTQGKLMLRYINYIIIIENH